MNTFDAATISIYKMPEQGDRVLFADGSLWTIKQRDGRKWGLYAEDNYLHPAIGLHEAMVDFCGSVNAQGEFLATLPIPAQ